MLSYRHLFHAGNFADVHKHLAWLTGIHALLKKPAPFCLLDVYAGAGEYDLGSPEAGKTREWHEGIGRLWPAADAPHGVRAYLDLIDDQTRIYPGSPMLAAGNLRAGDRLICFELHPADYATLKSRFANDARVHVHRRDAREGLAALLPPKERRGLVLIDPPYERDAEYEEVPAMLESALARWPDGGYLVWYPMLAADRHAAMLDAIEALQPKRLFVHELRLLRETPGLQGSGVAWINPPWRMDETLREAAAWIASRLEARAVLHWRIQD